MANLSKRRLENISGNFYVDDTCIDCDTCRWVASETFYRKAGQSAVFHQPENSAQEISALQALISCPTASIGMENPSDKLKLVRDSFPINIEENVFYCGYHSEKSFGATSYFIQRPEGNILIDSPRFASVLVKRIEELGGIKYQFLTHRDDVADHEKFKQHFGCKRIIHKNDKTFSIRDIEIGLDGSEAIQIEPGLLIIPVPGHTKGHSVLLYREKFLFTGDHLAYSPGLKNLYAFKDTCWYSWSEQIKSMKKLLDYSFEWVLPGHGRRFNTDKKTMRLQLEKCVAWMKTM
jgi:glyoxylase-like metal-dependent hydrolase (beta-lactamase superfamily II)/ferredoxin